MDYMTVDGTCYNVKTDPQQNRVYAWELAHVAPIDTNKITIEVAEQIVAYVWAEEGLSHPPKVEFINDKRGNRSATGCRLKLRFPAGLLYSWVVLHELAHAMTSNVDGASNGHGAWYMQVYTNLLNKYAGMDLLMMYHTAAQMNVKIKGVNG